MANVPTKAELQEKIKQTERRTAKAKEEGKGYAKSFQRRLDSLKAQLASIEQSEMPKANSESFHVEVLEELILSYASGKEPQYSDALIELVKDIEEKAKDPESIERLEKAMHQFNLPKKKKKLHLNHVRRVNKFLAYDGWPKSYREWKQVHDSLVACFEYYFDATREGFYIETSEGELEGSMSVECSGRFIHLRVETIEINLENVFIGEQSLNVEMTINGHNYDVENFPVEISSIVPFLALLLKYDVTGYDPFIY